MTGLMLPYKNRMPKIAGDAFIAPTATVVGDVEIGARSSIWFGVVIRGDVNEIRIGERTNVQDNTVIHVTRNGLGTYIGSGVTIGHMALLHACTLEDGSFIGMGAKLMDGVVVESGAMVAAGALVTMGKRVKAGELWAGYPARCVRKLTREEADFLPDTNAHYAKLGAEYLAALKE
ncbi:MAG: gamma carbonic anhydrase family protein [Alphaproteobacteria bacterium]|nr:gamma carbonic anhydrase family protein [Alphaproteobacteria bacterium]